MTRVFTIAAFPVLAILAVGMVLFTWAFIALGDLVGGRDA